MSDPWFRYYRAALHDPKVQRLPGETFKGWVNLLCIADDDGYLPAVGDIAFVMRKTEKQVNGLISDLQAAMLVDVGDDDQLRIHNWDKWQRKSDVSTPRVKRFRERKAKQDETVSETVQSRAEAEQSRADARGAPFHNLETVGAKACEAAGLDPGRVAVDFVEVQRWLTAGYDTERDILASIKAVASRPGYQPPNSLKYFTKAISETHAARLDPLAIPAFLDRRKPPSRPPNIVVGSPEDLAAKREMGLA